MKVDYIKKNWNKQGSAISYPYGWQYPNITEQWVFDTIIKNSIDNKYLEIVCFPWATLIDLIERNKKEADYFIESINRAPPKKRIIRVTICQHVKMKILVEYFKKLKVDVIYWSHKKLYEDNIENIKIKTLPLYPVVAIERSEDLKYNEEKERKYFFGFIGAYDKQCYISDIREKIFMQKYNYPSFIKKRNQWHYENIVYKHQVMGEIITDDERDMYNENSKEYFKVLKNTKYSLCPSGAGPNSIRLWESVMAGCIPIILSDNMDTSACNSFKFIKWNECEFKEKIKNFEIKKEEQIKVDNVDYFLEYLIFEFKKNDPKGFLLA